MHDGFDIAYFEFSERGNVFDRKRMNQVLDYVAEQARYDPSNPERGVFTIVFVHGWKHTARADDENVRSFHKLARQIHRLSGAPGGTPRKVIGIYVGWPGLSLNWGFLTNLSFWGRKAVAEQVAKGGVTELLLRLEREVIDDELPNRNLYVVTGHSFGGAIVLSALNEVFLERVAAATAKKPDDACVQTRPFGHGVVLLNPASDANEVLQLKELVAETCFVPTQPRLLHVISSDAGEAAIKVAFRLGQWLRFSLTWRQATLVREFDGRAVQFQESDLDTITVGDFKPFQTGQLERSDSADGTWRYRSCQEAACLDPAYRAQHIPVEHNDPLAFIHADKGFIPDDNDVFNDNVLAYLAAVMAENRYKRILDDSSVVDQRLPEECRSDAFGPCFDLYQKWFESVE